MKNIWESKEKKWILKKIITLLSCVKDFNISFQVLMNELRSGMTESLVEFSKSSLPSFQTIPTSQPSSEAHQQQS